MRAVLAFLGVQAFVIGLGGSLWVANTQWAPRALTPGVMLGGFGLLWVGGACIFAYMVADWLCTKQERE